MYSNIYRINFSGFLWFWLLVFSYIWEYVSWLLVEMKKSTKKWCSDSYMQLRDSLSFHWHMHSSLLCHRSIFSSIFFYFLLHCMKKIFLLFTFLMSCIFGNIFISSPVSANCLGSIDGVWIKSLWDCKPSNAVGITDSNLAIDGNESTLKDRVNKWIQTIATLTALGAVGALVYAGMLMQFSGGNEDTVNKGKEIIKITIIGLAIVTVAGGLVYLVMSMIFALT